MTAPAMLGSQRVRAEIRAGRPPLFIAHAPAHSFITDLPAEALMNP